MARVQQIDSTSQPSVSDRMPGVKRFKGEVNLRSLHQANPERYPHLLESTAKSDSARYSILFSFPSDTLLLNEQQQLFYNDEAVTDSNDFLQQFDNHWQQQEKQHDSDNSLPFSGGWFLYLGYELAQQIESRLKLPMPDDGFPIACAVRIPAAVIVDHVNDESILVAENEWQDLLVEIEEDINAVAGNNVTPEVYNHAVNIKEEEPQRYTDNVAKVRKYIVDGDVFQVNLSRRWTAKRPGGLSDFDVYQKLSRTNPAPFSGLMHFPFGSIISSSPERLLSVEKGIAKTRPIAGTRPRSKDDLHDSKLKDELIAHPKERAEHIMLIDLERNDLGRVCEPGTVEVDELMVMESYAHVHHIVSNVKGKLREGVKPGQAIKAVFPGGTITGCPKERCMAIIAELEQEARGAYTGSVGYVNHNGNMDLNILIRTITMTDKEIRLRAGAGLVFDSIAEKELEETRHKAKGMLLALGADDE